MKTLKVKNRSNSNVGYSIPEVGEVRNIRRDFAPKEVKEISPKEIEALRFTPGGEVLLNKFFQILDEEYVAANMVVEPEYFMSEEDVKNIVLAGDINEFLDCLDNAPQGVIDLIKEYAVSLPCNDVAKRNAILEKTGLDVGKAIEISKPEPSKDEGENVEGSHSNTNSKRRASTPKYNIIK